MSRIHILHLSDIHFQVAPDKIWRNLEREKIWCELIKTIDEHIANQKIKLDFVAVTGDISFSGKENEYKEVLKYFKTLKQVVGRKTPILTVPGNHDLDQSKIKWPSLRETVTSGKSSYFLEDSANITNMLKSRFFFYYGEFLKATSPNAAGKSEDYFWVKKLAGKKVSVLGLNSAWASEKDTKEDYGKLDIGDVQCRQALNKADEDSFKILLIHHPFSWINPGEFRKYENQLTSHCRLILHGHNHQDTAECHILPTHSFIRICANASYTDHQTDGFLGFHFIELNCDDHQFPEVTIWPYIWETRSIARFAPDFNRHKGQQGPSYCLTTKVANISGEAVEHSQNVIERIPEEYIDWIDLNHSNISFEALSKKGEVFLVKLKGIYISLETKNPFHKPDKDRSGSKRKKSKTDELVDSLEEKSSIDIEDLIGKKAVILLQGSAGSGKTTLIKHLAYSILHTKTPADLHDYLPILIFLRDVWPIYVEEKQKSGGNVDFRSILEKYLLKSKLSMDIVENFASRHRALFLMDGLDEVPAEIRDEFTDLIKDFQFKHRENRFMISGREHGLNGRILTYYRSDLSEIDPLTPDKVQEFIRKWFQTVFSQTDGTVKVTADDLIHDTEQHDHIQEFTRNPLLLTAVCILYLDSRRIPDQRAELYDRIVDNLLYRRFHGNPKIPELLVRDFLAELAFDMQQKNLLTIDTGDAKEILKRVIKQQENEDPRQYNRRIASLFDEIEPHCGLFRRVSDMEIGWIHKTFREYFTAKYMIDYETDYQPFLTNEDWEETTFLYTGLLSLHSRERSNRMVDKLIDVGYTESDEHQRWKIWTRAGRALCDLQRRDETVVKKVVERLLTVIGSDADVDVRFKAGMALGYLGDPRLSEDNMILIPEGEFLRGSNQGDDEKPEQRIWLDMFWIGRFPVTNQEYGTFIAADGYNNEDVWSSAGWMWKDQEKIVEPLSWHDRRWNAPNLPVVGVSWYEAEAYANWLSRQTGQHYHLPTDAQWEKAARGTDGREYPWGNKLEPDRCNYDQTGLNRTSSVGTFPKGASPWGCHDMSGNVWEWCLDWYGQYSPQYVRNPMGPDTSSGRVLRGGSWIDDGRGVRSAYRRGIDPGDRFGLIGFRLARGQQKGSGKGESGPF